MPDVRKERCAQILQSPEAIRDYMEPISAAGDFLTPKTGQLHLDAITLRLQVIGENAKQIETVHPLFFLKELTYGIGYIIRFRDFISHHFEKFDFEIIYALCVRKLPKFESVIRDYLER